MSLATLERPAVARSTRHAESMKERARKRKALASTAGPVFRAVDRGRLASILAPFGIDLDYERLELPATLVGIPVLESPSLRTSTPTSAGPLHGRIAEAAAEEHAALRANARGATSYGDGRELWGVRTQADGTRWFVASASAMHSRFPDLYTRERRIQAGIHSPAGDGVPLQIERFGPIPD